MNKKIPRGGGDSTIVVAFYVVKTLNLTFLSSFNKKILTIIGKSKQKMTIIIDYLTLDPLSRIYFYFHYVDSITSACSETLQGVVRNGRFAGLSRHWFLRDSLSWDRYRGTIPLLIIKHWKNICHLFVLKLLMYVHRK